MRNPNGYGSISKLSGSRRKPYVVRITTGYTIDTVTETAKQIRQVLGYYSTRKEAMQALASYNDNPFDVDVMKVTFRQCYEEAKKDFSEARAHNYRSAYRYLEPIADLPIRSIKAAQMQKCIDSCQTTQQREIKTVCHKVFAYAIKNDIVDKDPSRYLRSNTVAPVIDREVFTPEQISDLWSRNDSASKITLILLYSGMRTKELMDLEPEQIDLDAGVIQILKAKNDSSVRKVPIHDRVFDLLRDFKRQPYKLSHNGLNKALKQRYGHTAHDCRHTFATRMRECGVDLLPLQLILGHTPQTITEKIYTHITDEELKNEVNKLVYLQECVLPIK